MLGTYPWRGVVTSQPQLCLSPSPTRSNQVVFISPWSRQASLLPPLSLPNQCPSWKLNFWRSLFWLPRLNQVLVILFRCIPSFYFIGFIIVYSYILIYNTTYFPTSGSSWEQSNIYLTVVFPVPKAVTEHGTHMYLLTCDEWRDEWMNDFTCQSASLPISILSPTGSNMMEKLVK